MRREWFRFAPLLPFLCAACRGSLQTEPERFEPASRSEERALAPAVVEERGELAGWRELDRLAFEEDFASLGAAGAIRWSASARSAYSAALRGYDEVALRAALLLALDRGRAATEALMAQLELRSAAPTRFANGVDIVCAAALEGRLDAALAARLLALVEGPLAHPDLELRVECARLLAGLRERAALPFLFRVLRVQTPDEALDSPDWEPVSTLFWAKQRAAEALSAWAERPLTFLPDASFVDQARQAAELAEALDYRPSRTR